MFNMQANNKASTIALYKKQGRERKEQRAAELESGSPLTKDEKFAQMEQSLKEDESRIGVSFEGNEARDPHHRSYTPSVVMKITDSFGRTNFYGRKD